MFGPMRRTGPWVLLDFAVLERRQDSTRKMLTVLLVPSMDCPVQLATGGVVGYIPVGYGGHFRSRVLRQWMQVYSTKKEAQDLWLFFVSLSNVIGGELLTLARSSPTTNAVIWVFVIDIPMVTVMMAVRRGMVL